MLEGLGSKLSYFRKEKGLSMKELADGLCDYTTIYRVEKGKQLPRLEILNEICMKLEIPFQSLFPFNEEVVRLKKLCREFTYNEDYLSLEITLENCGELLKKISSTYTYKEFRKFILMHRAVLLHKRDNNAIKALNILRPLVKVNNAVSELDFGILNSIGLINLSQNNYESAYKIYHAIYQKIKLRNIIEDPTLIPRVGYNYANSLFKLKKYEDSLQIIQEVHYYLETQQSIYLLGETFHMVAVLSKKLGSQKEAEEAIKNAILVFSLTKNEVNLTKSKAFLSNLQAK
ncbi:helix-turn-helix domain-containing protein [Psychrobacillus sp. FSL K6-2684]|uniref:helix-turn-helix domain-containing protein n=1 Tax=unclassified Psychrobacillus TaxID=2636677 RepID=UPI0030FC1AB6